MIGINELAVFGRFCLSESRISRIKMSESGFTGLDCCLNLCGYSWTLISSSSRLSSDEMFNGRSSLIIFCPGYRAYLRSHFHR